MTPFLYSDIKWLTEQKQWKSFEQYIQEKLDRLKNELLVKEKDDLFEAQIEARTIDMVLKLLRQELEIFGNRKEKK